MTPDSRRGRRPGSRAAVHAGASGADPVVSGGYGGDCSGKAVRCVAMGIRDRLLAGVARQLGKPEGATGRLFAVALNRGNRGMVTAAINAAQIAPGDHVADAGFGGGLSLALLLDRVGPTGHVDGIELSGTMLATAQRHFRAASSDGRLALQHGSITETRLGNASLDALITVNTIYFVDNLELAFSELARVVRPSGRAVIGLGDPEAMASLPFTAYGFRLRPVAEVAQLLAKSGLTKIRDERVGDGKRAYHLLIATRDQTLG
jgi:arsenite methyltransferase